MFRELYSMAKTKQLYKEKIKIIKKIYKRASPPMNFCAESDSCIRLIHMLKKKPDIYVNAVEAFWFSCDMNASKINIMAVIRKELLKINIILSCTAKIRLNAFLNIFLILCIL